MNAFESLQLISNDKIIWIEHVSNYGHIFKGPVKTDNLKRYPNRILHYFIDTQLMVRNQTVHTLFVWHIETKEVL